MTERRVAFLRGINVGGRRITGPEMVGIAAEAGFTDAVSYQASGNLVFDADASREAIESALVAAFVADRGWKVDVFVRTVRELVDAAAAMPFSIDELEPRGKPQVGFTRQPVDVASVSVERDLIASLGTQIYWVPHTGVSDADLQMADIERAAGSVTFRTLGTVERLIAKFT